MAISMRRCWYARSPLTETKSEAISEGVRAVSKRLRWLTCPLKCLSGWPSFLPQRKMLPSNIILWPPSTAKGIWPVLACSSVLGKKLAPPRMPSTKMA